MQAASAGLAPASIVQPLTQKVMADKNIDITHQFPKDLSSVDIANFDVIVNMSGNRLPQQLSVPVREWKIADPIGETEDFYVSVRDQIENEVMRLILELRKDERDTRPSSDERPSVSRRLRMGGPRKIEAPQR